MRSNHEDPLPILTAPRYGSVMSASNIDELAGKVESGYFAKYNRSSSVGPGVTASNLNSLQRNRRALSTGVPKGDPFVKYMYQLMNTEDV